MIRIPALYGGHLQSKAPFESDLYRDIVMQHVGTRRTGIIIKWVFIEHDTTKNNFLSHWGTLPEETDIVNFRQTQIPTQTDIKTDLGMYQWPKKLCCLGWCWTYPSIWERSSFVSSLVRSFRHSDKTWKRDRGSNWVIQGAASDLALKAAITE